jgi:PhzF family phenazine biosynthesis protein
MSRWRFQVLNVFAEEPFGGNPLAVFEAADGLSSEQMQAITDQFNLAETTFILPPERGQAARVRIFSPGYEMAFAGHPTLGTAHVVRQLLGTGDAFRLELPVGDIAVEGRADRWQLTAAQAQVRPTSVTRAEQAAVLGLLEHEVEPGAAWVSTGQEQLLIPLGSVEALRRVQVRPEALFTHARNPKGQVNAYAFARTPRGFESRFFWEHQGAVREDPGTGSACANLGSWLLHHGERGPFTARVEQGRHVGRLNVLTLSLSEAGAVGVGGRVVPLMTGELALP